MFETTNQISIPFKHYQDFGHFPSRSRPRACMLPSECSFVLWICAQDLSGCPFSMTCSSSKGSTVSFWCIYWTKSAGACCSEPAAHSTKFEHTNIGLCSNKTSPVLPTCFDYSVIWGCGVQCKTDWLMIFFDSIVPSCWIIPFLLDIWALLRERDFAANWLEQIGSCFFSPEIVEAAWGLPIFRHVRCFPQEESHGNQHVEMGRKTGWFSCNDPINAEDEHRMVPPPVMFVGL